MFVAAAIECLRLRADGELYRGGHQGEHSSLSLRSNSFFAEPALGCRIKLFPRVALNLSAGYEWDFSTPSYKASGNQTAITPDWSGWRVSAGVAYHWSLRR